MATAVTLSLSSSFILTKPKDRLIAIMQNCLYGMRQESDVCYPLIVSIPELITTFMNSPTTLANQVETALKECYTRSFPDASVVTVSVTTSAVTVSTYSLVIEVQLVINGIAYSIDPKLSVANGFITTAFDVIDLSVVTNEVG